MEEILKNEFQFYVKLAKPLVLNLPKSEDRILAASWIKKFLDEESGVERLRTTYLKLLLFCLQRRKLTGIFADDPTNYDELEELPVEFDLNDLAKNLLEQEQIDRREKIRREMMGDMAVFPAYTTDVSPNLTEYVAAQDIPNFGVHAYYAISKEPINKWQRSEKAIFPKGTKSAIDTSGTGAGAVGGASSEPSVPPPKKPVSAEKEAGGETEKKDKTPERKRRTPRKMGHSPPSSPIGVVHSTVEERPTPTWGTNLVEIREPIGLGEDQQEEIEDLGEDLELEDDDFGLLDEDDMNLEDLGMKADDMRQIIDEWKQEKLDKTKSKLRKPGSKLPKPGGRSGLPKPKGRKPPEEAAGKAPTPKASTPRAKTPSPQRPATPQRAPSPRQPSPQRQPSPPKAAGPQKPEAFADWTEEDLQEAGLTWDDLRPIDTNIDDLLKLSVSEDEEEDIPEIILPETSFEKMLREMEEEMEKSTHDAGVDEDEPIVELYEDQLDTAHDEQRITKAVEEVRRASPAIASGIPVTTPKPSPSPRRPRSPERLFAEEGDEMLATRQSPLQSLPKPTKQLAHTPPGAQTMRAPSPQPVHVDTQGPSTVKQPEISQIFEEAKSAVEEDSFTQYEKDFEEEDEFERLEREFGQAQPPTPGRQPPMMTGTPDARATEKIKERARQQELLLRTGSPEAQAIIDEAQAELDQMPVEPPQQAPPPPPPEEFFQGMSYDAQYSVENIWGEEPPEVPEDFDEVLNESWIDWEKDAEERLQDISGLEDIPCSPCGFESPIRLTEDEEFELNERQLREQSPSYQIGSQLFPLITAADLPPPPEASPPQQRMSPQRVSPEQRASPLQQQVPPPQQRVSPPQQRFSPQQQRVSPPQQRASPRISPQQQRSPPLGPVTPPAQFPMERPEAYFTPPSIPRSPCMSPMEDYYPDIWNEQMEFIGSPRTPVASPQRTPSPQPRRTPTPPPSPYAEIPSFDYGPQDILEQDDFNMGFIEEGGLLDESLPDVMDAEPCDPCDAGLPMTPPLQYFPTGFDLGESPPGERVPVAEHVIDRQFEDPTRWNYNPLVNQGKRSMRYLERKSKPKTVLPPPAEYLEEFHEHLGSPPVTPPMLPWRMPYERAPSPAREPTPPRAPSPRAPSPPPLFVPGISSPRTPPAQYPEQRPAAYTSPRVQSPIGAYSELDQGFMEEEMPELFDFDEEPCDPCGSGPSPRSSPQAPLSPRRVSPAARSPRQPTPRQPTPRGPSPRQPSPRQPSPRQPSPRQPSPRQPSPRQPSPRQPSPRQPSPRQPSPRQPSTSRVSPRQTPSPRRSPAPSPRSPMIEEECQPCSSPLPEIPYFTTPFEKMDVGDILGADYDDLFDIGFNELPPEDFAPGFDQAMYFPPGFEQQPSPQPPTREEVQQWEIPQSFRDPNRPGASRILQPDKRGHVLYRHSGQLRPDERRLPDFDEFHENLEAMFSGEPTTVDDMGTKSTRPQRNWPRQPCAALPRSPRPPKPPPKVREIPMKPFSPLSNDFYQTIAKFMGESLKKQTPKRKPPKPKTPTPESDEDVLPERYVYKPPLEKAFLDIADEADLFDGDQLDLLEESPPCNLVYDYGPQISKAIQEFGQVVNEYFDMTPPSPIQSPVYTRARTPSPRQPSPRTPSPAQPSPRQPSPRQPSPRQPSPRQPSPGQPSPRRPSPLAQMEDSGPCEPCGPPAPPPCEPCGPSEAPVSKKRSKKGIRETKSQQLQRERKAKNEQAAKEEERKIAEEKALIEAKKKKRAEERKQAQQEARQQQRAAAAAAAAEAAAAEAAAEASAAQQVQGLRPPSGMRVPSGLRPPSASGLRPPSASGLRPPSASGLRPPSASGLRPPSASGLRPPSASGLRPPSAAGLRQPSSTRQPEYRPAQGSGIAPEHSAQKAPIVAEPDRENIAGVQLFAGRKPKKGAKPSRGAKEKKRRPKTKPGRAEDVCKGPCGGETDRHLELSPGKLKELGLTADDFNVFDTKWMKELDSQQVDMSDFDEREDTAGVYDSKLMAESAAYEAMLRQLEAEVADDAAWVDQMTNEEREALGISPDARPAPIPQRSATRHPDLYFPPSHDWAASPESPPFPIEDYDIPDEFWDPDRSQMTRMILNADKRRKYMLQRSSAPPELGDIRELEEPASPTRTPPPQYPMPRPGGYMTPHSPAPCGDGAPCGAEEDEYAAILAELGMTEEQMAAAFDTGFLYEQDENIPFDEEEPEELQDLDVDMDLEGYAGMDKFLNTYEENLRKLEAEIAADPEAAAMYAALTPTKAAPCASPHWTPEGMPGPSRRFSPMFTPPEEAGAPKRMMYPDDSMSPAQGPPRSPKFAPAKPIKKRGAPPQLSQMQQDVLKQLEDINRQYGDKPTSPPRQPSPVQVGRQSPLLSEFDLIEQQVIQREQEEKEYFERMMRQAAEAEQAQPRQASPPRQLSPTQAGRQSPAALDYDLIEQQVIQREQEEKEYFERMMHQAAEAEAAAAQAQQISPRQASPPRQSPAVVDYDLIEQQVLQREQEEREYFERMMREEAGQGAGPCQGSPGQLEFEELERQMAAEHAQQATGLSPDQLEFEELERQMALEAASQKPLMTREEREQLEFEELERQMAVDEMQEVQPCPGAAPPPKSPDMFDNLLDAFHQRFKGAAERAQEQILRKKLVDQQIALQGSPRRDLRYPAEGIITSPPRPKSALGPHKWAAFEQKMARERNKPARIPTPPPPDDIVPTIFDMPLDDADLGWESPPLYGGLADDARLPDFAGPVTPPLSPQTVRRDVQIGARPQFDPRKRRDVLPREARQVFKQPSIWLHNIEETDEACLPCGSSAQAVEADASYLGAPVIPGQRPPRRQRLKAERLERQRLFDQEDNETNRYLRQLEGKFDLPELPPEPESPDQNYILDTSLPEDLPAPMAPCWADGPQKLRYSPPRPQPPAYPSELTFFEPMNIPLHPDLVDVANWEPPFEPPEGPSTPLGAEDLGADMMYSPEQYEDVEEYMADLNAERQFEMPDILQADRLRSPEPMFPTTPPSVGRGPCGTYSPTATPPLSPVLGSPEMSLNDAFLESDLRDTDYDVRELLTRTPPHETDEAMEEMKYRARVAKGKVAVQPMFFGGYGEKPKKWVPRWHGARGTMNVIAEEHGMGPAARSPCAGQRTPSPRQRTPSPRQRTPSPRQTPARVSPPAYEEFFEPGWSPEQEAAGIMDEGFLESPFMSPEGSPLRREEFFRFEPPTPPLESPGDVCDPCDVGGQDFGDMSPLEMPEYAELLDEEIAEDIFGDYESPPRMDTPPRRRIYQQSMQQLREEYPIPELSPGPDEDFLAAVRQHQIDEDFNDPQRMQMRSGVVMVGSRSVRLPRHAPTPIFAPTPEHQLEVVDASQIWPGYEERLKKQSKSARPKSARPCSGASQPAAEKAAPPKQYMTAEEGQRRARARAAAARRKERQGPVLTPPRPEPPKTKLTSFVPSQVQRQMPCAPPTQQLVSVEDFLRGGPVPGQRTAQGAVRPSARGKGPCSGISRTSSGTRAKPSSSASRRPQPPEWQPNLSDLGDFLRAGPPPGQGPSQPQQSRGAIPKTSSRARPPSSGRRAPCQPAQQFELTDLDDFLRSGPVPGQGPEQEAPRRVVKKTSSTKRIVTRRK